MKIVSWNVNSVRARIENILNYIKDTNPDILFLQEIKTENINFPSEAFKKNGYNSYVFGQKSYNGVAFLSKCKITNKNPNIQDKIILTLEIIIINTINKARINKLLLKNVTLTFPCKIDDDNKATIIPII